MQDGTLRVGMLWIAGYLNLPSILTDFHQRHPGITYKVSVDGSKALLQMLLARSLNAAFIISYEPVLRKEEDLYYQKLQDDYYVAVVNKAHPFAKKDVLSMEEFHRYQSFYSICKALLFPLVADSFPPTKKAPSYPSGKALFSINILRRN